MKDRAVTQTIPPPAVIVRDVSMHYGKTLALDHISVEIPSGVMVGLLGPDGVGKSSLLSLITGVHALQEGFIQVLGGDIRSKLHRNKVCPKIAYMPQGLGKNLYFTLSVEENLQYFARLFGHGPEERRRRIDTLTRATGLYPFLDRPAGKLSGGMKQKLGLCCSLIHDQDLLVLDEPTTGVDPLARRQFWNLIDKVRETQPGMSVIVATAYMDEAQRFDYLIAMDEGKILDKGSPEELMKKTQSDCLDTAFIRLLPEEKRAGHRVPEVPPLPPAPESGFVIEAKDLTKRFGSFTAVDHVNFQISQGEIFGFLGSNGCGKSTTMRMLTGLLPATEGTALLFGSPVNSNTMEIRENLGYMTQAFSLYSELTVRQNLVLYARLFRIKPEEILPSVERMLKRFQLESVENEYPDSLPLGIRQRLSLAAAVIHGPKILILDEPTSGVDPVARDSFWELIIELSRKDAVTIFITTHFMNEALRCDRISMMHAGKSIACDTPQALIRERKAATLEEAFIGYLEEADPAGKEEPGTMTQEKTAASLQEGNKTSAFRTFLKSCFDPGRCFTCAWRETLELLRDPIRLTLALFGALILMLVIGFGINMDVENLSFAILDRDQSLISQSYASSIRGSRYFTEKPPIRDYLDMDKRMRNGDVSMVLEFPPQFGKDVEKGLSPQIGVWIDGAMPSRAQTISGYVQGIHSSFLSDPAQERLWNGNSQQSPARVALRYRYNPDVLSLPAMVPAVLPVLLMMIPAILAALAVVREKEMGSIINLYATPMTRTEFLLGKQLPYILFSFVSAILMLLEARFIFQIPAKGSLPVLLLSLLIYCVCSTGVGLLASSLTRSQIAVIFMTMVGTMIPAVQYCGMVNPVSTLSGVGKLVGTIYPTTYMLIISRGVFNKALGFPDLHVYILILAVSAIIITGCGVMLQKKQDT